jgi:hypothetical protein
MKEVSTEWIVKETGQDKIVLTMHPPSSVQGDGPAMIKISSANFSAPLGTDVGDVVEVIIRLR